MVQPLGGRPNKKSSCHLGYAHREEREGWSPWFLLLLSLWLPGHKETRCLYHILPAIVVLHTLLRAKAVDPQACELM